MTPLPLKFIKSAPKASHLPADQGHEIVLAGYSNVGKSSMINLIANIKDLAKCSKTPGRTQLFNVFATPSGKRVLDLPGYGFAKAPAAVKNSWIKHLNDYLISRQSLKGLLIITDIRRGLRPIDEALIQFCEDYQIPFVIVLNKADKVSRQTTLISQRQLTQTLSLTPEQVLLASCLKRTGVEAILTQIKYWLEL